MSYSGRLPGALCRSDCRSGKITFRGLLTLAIGVVVLAGGGSFLLPSLSRSSANSGPMMHRIERAEFFHDITERGELESANNVEIRCEVKSLGTSGTTILELIPEGTMVQPGDILVKLDSSSLDNDRTRQQIAVANSEAEVIKARTTYDTACVTLKEYLEGTYVQNKQLAESEVYLQKENLRRANEYLAYSEILKNKGYVTASQLEADSFAARKAEKDLEAAQTKVDVLVKYTMEKMKKQLQSDIEAAAAKLKAMEHSNDLELGKLADIESQIEKCVIRAPCAGQVVYANVTNTWGGREVIIEAGVTVRERQEIVRLPDHTQMQVKAKINEAKVAMVAVGMPATVRLDAFPDLELEGTVQRVNEYPAPSNRFSSSVKEYETLIRIHKPPPGARPGLTAEVKIHVEHQANALIVPVQTLFEHGTRQYAVLPDGDGFTAREVQVGSTNDKFVVVREGLEEGQEIVLNAAAYRTKVDLPELLPEKSTISSAQIAAAKARKAAPVKSNGPRGLSETRPVQVHRIPLSDPNTAATVQRIFDQFDPDKDGRIPLTILPESIRSQLASGDTNHDGNIDRKELVGALNRILQINGKGRSSRGGNGL